MSVAEVRALLPDSVLKLVCTNGVDVANITHLGRGPNAAQKLALLWTDRCAARWGVSRTHTEYDHRLDYRITKHTRLDELDALCDPTTTSRPTTGGHSFPAPADDPWSHPPTPATPTTWSRRVASNPNSSRTPADGAVSQRPRPRRTSATPDTATAAPTIVTTMGVAPLSCCREGGAAAVVERGSSRAPIAVQVHVYASSSARTTTPMISRNDPPQIINSDSLGFGPPR